MPRYVASLESGKLIPDRPQRILVAVDFSPESAAALRYAMTLSAPKTHIDVVHVWDLPPYVGGAHVDARLTGQPQAPRFAAQWVHDVAADALAAFVRPWCDDPRVHPLLLNGEIGRVLADLSKRGYDLVLIGRKPYAGVRELFLGSAAAAVITEAPCPVVTVHEEQEEERASRPSRRDDRSPRART